MPDDATGAGRRVVRAGCSRRARLTVGAVLLMCAAGACTGGGTAGSSSSRTSSGVPSSAASSSAATAAPSGAADAVAAALRARITPPALPSFSLPTDLLTARDRRFEDALRLQPGLYQGIAVLDARCDGSGRDRAADDGTATPDGAGHWEDAGRSITVAGDGTGVYDAHGLHVAVLPGAAGVYDDGQVRLTVQAGGAGTWTAGGRRLTVRADGSGSYQDPDVRLWVGSDGAGGYDDGTTRVSLTAAGHVDGRGADASVQGALQVIRGRLPVFAPVPVITRVAPEGVRCGTVLRLDANVLFDLDRAAVRPDAAELLDRVAALLREMDSPRTRVDGHTDTQGSDEHNQGLSERRAQAVRAFLAARGVSSDALQAQGHGERRPLRTEVTADGDVDEAARRLNRRVELVLLDDAVR